MLDGVVRKVCAQDGGFVVVTRHDSGYESPKLVLPYGYLHPQPLQVLLNNRGDTTPLLVRSAEYLKLDRAPSGVNHPISSSVLDPREPRFHQQSSCLSRIVGIFPNGRRMPGPNGRRHQALGFLGPPLKHGFDDGLLADLLADRPTKVNVGKSLPLGW